MKITLGLITGSEVSFENISDLDNGDRWLSFESKEGHALNYNKKYVVCVLLEDVMIEESTESLEKEDED